MHLWSWLHLPSCNDQRKVGQRVVRVIISAAKPSTSRFQEGIEDQGDEDVTSSSIRQVKAFDFMTRVCMVKPYHVCDSYSYDLPVCKQHLFVWSIDYVIESWSIEYRRQMNSTTWLRYSWRTLPHVSLGITHRQLWGALCIKYSLSCITTNTRACQASVTCDTANFT